MVNIITQKYIRVLREDYIRLKQLQKHFGVFWNYVEHMQDIKEARQEIRTKKTIAQEKLFEDIGLWKWNMEIRYAHKAADNLRKLPFDVQKRIAIKMRFYAEQKNPLKFAKCLQNRNEGEFGFRVGDYRIIFDVIRDTIFVLKIGKRDSVYE